MGVDDKRHALLDLLQSEKADPPAAKGWYNGFSPAERSAKLKALKLCMAVGAVPMPAGSCALCGDTDAALEYHSEDYSQPYKWAPPAMFVVCRVCHRSHLHRRFSNSERWELFVRHVATGGTARTLQNGTKLRSRE